MTIAADTKNSDKITLTENELRQLSQIAYLDIKGETGSGTALKIQGEYFGKNEQLSLGYLIDYYTKDQQGIDRLEERFGEEEAKRYRDTLEDLNTDTHREWQISNVVSHNEVDESGFVAMTVTTGTTKDPGPKVAVFRGSEPIENPLYWNDWKNNLSTSYADESIQQAEAEAYLENFAEYDGKLYMTGHSLGGNLALYASFILPEGQKDQLVTATTFNAPGFNRGVLTEYADRIAELNRTGRITEIRNVQDIVPALFYNPSEGVYIKTKGTGHGFEHHSMFNLAFDEATGEFVESDVQSGTAVPKAIHNLTAKFEDLPEVVRQYVCGEIFKLMDGRFHESHVLKLLSMIPGPGAVVAVVSQITRVLELLSALRAMIEGIIPWLEGKIADVKAIMATFWKESVETIKAITTEVMEAAGLIKNQIESLAKQVKEAVTGFMSRLKDSFDKFVDDAITAVQAKWDAIIQAKDNAVRKIGDVFRSVKATIKQEKDAFVAGVKSFKDRIVGRAKAGLAKTVGTIAAAASGVARGATILAHLDQLEDLHRTLQRKEERLAELAGRALSVASGVTSGVGGSYSEYYVQTQLRQVQSLCDAVRTEQRRVSESLAHYAKGLKFTLDKYRTMEAKLASMSLAALR
ncbi:Mbeg1-like protein [Paenibacillus aurantiacus]|uniref:Mbeg1-like protein n=1 Tax=Paenibacillus aurantiacus TaxID=1936118 RepID=A0ABV5KGT6_9BACL